jgi:hypothetical protein
VGLRTAGSVRDAVDEPPENLEREFDDARRVAEQLGCRLGDGVTLIHFDEGWLLDHAAFDRFRALGGTIDHFGQGNVASGRCGHGTSVLGMHIGARDRGPLLPGARIVLAQAIASDDLPPDKYLEQAVKHTEGARARVLLIARDWSSRAPHIPLELRAGMGDLIASAVQSGITVVEAAGNGGIDLDGLVRWNGRGVRGQISFANDPWRANDDALTPAFARDSGALIVGAATAGEPHRRWTAGFPDNPQPRSNFGQRVDCWAPGEQISTASIDELGWTTGFGGTSAAAALIAAKVTALQSLALALHPSSAPLSPSVIRDLFRDPSLGRPVWAGHLQLGAMPSLPAVVHGALSIAP